MNIKKLVFLVSIAACAAFFSCEKLAEEDTPICKDCYKVRFSIATSKPKDTLSYLRLCGGDVLAWQNFTDSIQDTLRIHCYCNN